MNDKAINLTDAKILVVDDVANNLDVLCPLLEDVGYRLFVANNGATAIDLANRLSPDLILLDVMMPDMNGYEVCQHLKADPTTQHIPVIFLTAQNDTQSLVTGFEVGGVDYISKPFQKSELLVRIENHLTLSRLKHDLEEQVDVRSRELVKQMELFRKFVPQSFTRDMNSDLYNEAEGLAREEMYTVFSCDIRNFTTFSESISCSECYRFLNSFFKVMEPGIRNFEGFVYQYVGDEIMGLFALEEGHYADNALKAAVWIQNHVIVDYNEGRKRAGYEPVRIGIGLNTGLVAIGIAGTTERMDACAFGNTVNVAARCESLTKEFDADIIITEDTYQRLHKPDAFDIHSLGNLPIRGLEKEIRLYEVRDVIEEHKN